MKYYVSIGDIELDKVIAVAQSSDRDISVYDSVGGGKFAVPQNKGLRTWTIKCEIDDHDLIKQFDKMQKKKTPVRLVINSDGYKVSERVLLKSYNAPEEEYAGVFPVTLTAIEYVKAGVKTAGVPYVAREGNRVLAAQVTIGDGKNGTMTPYDVAKYVQDMARATGDDAAALKHVMASQQAKSDGETNAKAPQYVMIDPNNGKRITNPAVLKTGEKVNLYTYQNLLDPEGELKNPAISISQSTINANDRVLKSIAWSEKAGKAMSDAWKKFNDDFTKHATGK